MESNNPRAAAPATEPAGAKAFADAYPNKWASLYELMEAYAASQAAPPAPKTCETCGRFMTRITRQQMGGAMRHSVEVLCMRCDLEPAQPPQDAVIDRWIPVSERLPEQEQPVLVYAPHYGCNDNMVVNELNGSEWRLEQDCGADGKVTHWQPLPAAPALPATKNEEK